MKILMLLLVAVKAVVISGKLIVLRGQEQTRYTHNNRKLLCVSNDDGSGLIWNSNLNWMYSSYEFSDRGGETDFQVLIAHPKGKIDCNLNSHEDCMSIWDTSGWDLTNSKAKPMGPVYDRRWEDFRELNNIGSVNEYRLTQKFEKSGALVISVRGSTDAHILLCDNENYEGNFCYWVIIGGWSNAESVIRKCANGVPKPAVFPIEPTCAQVRTSYPYPTLSSIEWKTFILTWNETTKNISVYDTEKLLMTYKDTEQRPRNETPEYNLFLRSSKAMLFRFHIYGYLHTTDPKAPLTSPIWHLNGTTVCIEMILGLCKECQMEIVLMNPFDESNKESLEIIKGSTTAGVHGLPTWRYVRIDKTVSPDFTRIVKVKLIPGLEQKSHNPLWAAANIRMCPRHGTVRYGSMQATQDYADYNYFWPPVTCQKLFYNENTVVNSVSDATTDLEFDDLYCPEGNVGPYCTISCYDLLENDVDCRGTVICDVKGCTCPPGFLGKDCNIYCSTGRYGDKCSQTCGKCRDNKCSFATGHCKSGCDNSNRYNIPPFCQTGIDVLPPPNLDFINETIIRVTLPVKEEYKQVSSDYQFLMRKDGETQASYIGDAMKILNNTKTLIGYSDNLDPGTSYEIACVLRVIDEAVYIRGEWQSFTTRCTSTRDFAVDVRNTSLTIKKIQQAEGSYPCPSKWYDFLFENHDSDGQISKGKLPELPHQFTKLTPYTRYKITISKGPAILFWQVIRTLDGPPSQVRNVKKVLLFNEKVTLRWDPPLHSNGIIQKYKVVLRVQTYIGCKNLRLEPRKYDTVTSFSLTTNITFSDLAPYAHYIVKIMACTTYTGPEASIEFSTDQTDTPTATYSNLRFQDYVLLWDEPEDCAKISGPIIAKLIVVGLSKAVSDFNIFRQTMKYYVNLGNVLYGAETYEARIYAIRGYYKEQNEQLYRKIIFTTPPKDPPPVRDLKVYEIDFQNMDAYLRWTPPAPPTNGEIQYYIVSTCYSNCEIVLKIGTTENCKLWSKYICATVKQLHRQITLITVAAVNANVSMPGATQSVPIIRAETKSEAPETFTAEILDKGVVNLTWSHPWKTGGHVAKFLIIVEMIATRLKMRIHQSQRGTIHEYRVDQYRQRYSEQLHLLSASVYKIYVRAVTNTETYGQKKLIQVQTPAALAFEKDLSTRTSDADSTISLDIPKIANDTKNSLMYVVVKGSQACENHTKLSPFQRKVVGLRDFEVAWCAATFSTDRFAGKTITIGDNKLYGGAKNCALKPTESYTIAVIVRADDESMDDQIMVARTTSIGIGEVPRRHIAAWLIPVTIFVLGGVMGVYFYRRQRIKSLKKLTLRNEVAFRICAENADEKSASANSKQASTITPTPSDKEFLSRASTPFDDGSLYANDVDQKEERRSLVKVKDFEEYVKRAVESELLHKQYSTLPRGQTKPWEYGKLPQNKPKNRYGNLIAYDENRVILKKLPDDPYSDYINANYIKGYRREKCYIATQGPKPNTIIDFWRMIWQEESYVICMLANIVEEGKTKCEQYWPDIGKKKRYGDIVVFNAKHTVFADFTFRTLHVTCGDEARKIEHLHYTAWPDHGVPQSTHSVVTYLKKLLATPPGNGPIVVHCSAGVGRTGTIILCDICLRRAAAEGVLDVFSETEAIRSQRPNMVDNNQQYLLAHLALVECLVSSASTSLPCDEILPNRINEQKKQLALQLDSLEKITWQDKALRPPISQAPLSERNLAKNRYPELTAAKVGRVYLKRYPPTDEDSDYICAVYADGVRLQNEYLATQLPLPGTFSDFWRMIAEYKTELIVMLQPPDLTDATCCPIVPSGEFKPVPYINIRTKEFLEFEHYTSQKLILVNNVEKPATEQQITILCSTQWKPGRNQDPPETVSLVSLWQTAERIPRGDGPTVVVCHDGVTGCGLYLALSFLLDKMTVERECDVCWAIRAVRRSRPDFVQSLEQMEYLYDAAITYLKYFETYANFT